MPVIDVHTHMFTPRWLELLQSEGGLYNIKTRPDGQQEVFRGDTPVVIPQKGHFDYEMRIRMMNEAGIDISIVSLTCPNVYWGNEDTSVRAARESNDTMAQAQTTWPDRIRWFTSLPWEYPARAVEELERTVQNGASGVMVLAWMRANPDKANFATSGAGTVPHFAGVLLSQAAGIPMTHVAYRGGALAAQDLIGGQVPMMIDTLSETLEHHKAGKVRIIAVTGEQRTRSLPDVPTLRELGINTAADAFFGLYGPAGMSSDVTARVDAAVGSILRDAAVQDKITNFGLVASHAGPAELMNTQLAHYRRWEAPIKASGFKAE